MRAALFIIPLCVLLVTGSARAAPDNPSAGDELALGMQGLFWGMSPEQVHQADPGLIAAPVPTARPDPPQSLAGSDIYDYEGCSFHRVFYFYHGHLSEIFLYSDGMTPCRDQVEDELNAWYGLENRTTDPRLSKFQTLSYRWRNGVTSVWYGFQDPGIEIVFSDMGVNSREGFYLFHCENIAVSFAPNRAPDGVSDPAVDRTALNLDCEYPHLATVTRARGTVVLHVQILADGTVANAQLVQGDPRNKFLSDAALALARTRLRFQPPIKDGQPVAIERDIQITFRIVRTMRFVT